MGERRPPKNETGETVQTDEGPVRPGNRTPYKKAGRDEVEARVIFTRGLLARKAYESEVRAILRRRYNVKHRQAGVYIARARRLLRAEAGLSPEQARCDSIALYNSLVRECDDPRVRLLAQKRLDELFGIDAPPKAPVGPTGYPVPAAAINITNVRAALGNERGRELLAQLAEHAAGLDRPECGLKQLPPDVAQRMSGGLPP
jgi:hypothetical protein